MIYQARMAWCIAITLRGLVCVGDGSVDELQAYC
jgi:hypothetical protein